MFMRENRKKNGAAQPEKLAGEQSSDQKSARKLSPNEYPTGSPEDWRFSAKLETCDSINEAHYQAGISGDGPYKDAYASAIPFVGVKVPVGKDQELKD